MKSCPLMVCLLTLLSGCAGSDLVALNKNICDGEAETTMKMMGIFRKVASGRMQ